MDKVMDWCEYRARGQGIRGFFAVEEEFLCKILGAAHCLGIKFLFERAGGALMYMHEDSSPEEFKAVYLGALYRQERQKLAVGRRGAHCMSMT
jgi:hypothetical protein